MFITAYNGGAGIHTNSWGGYGNAYESLGQSLDYFVWKNRDFLVLFANGNAGPDEYSVGIPATAKNIISVGATVNGDGAEEVAHFSSNGPTADGRIKPTVTAPGVDIVSADSDGLKNSYNNGTRSFSGTSMATPAVAGAAAMVRQYFMDGFYPTGTANPADAFTPSAALVKGVLVNSAQEMTGAFTDGPIPSTGQGWGRVNLSSALVFEGDAKSLAVVDDTAGLETGETWSVSYSLTPGQPLKVTLVWNDYPGTPGTEKALVNDLDLVVTGPGGIYRGNVFSGGESVTGGAADDLNVEEQVLIKNPSAGQYTITVSAFNVPYGPQPFAVVTSGAPFVSQEGFIALDRSIYNDSGTVNIKVGDLGLNLDGNVAEEVDVTITSTTEDYGETVRLVETSGDSAYFIGSIPLAPAVYRNPAKGWEGVPGNGYLEVAGGDVITAIYNDADDGTGAPAVATDTAVVDNTPPVITSVSAGDIGDTYATVSWATDEPADSEVSYGDTPSLGISFSTPWLKTQHSLKLTNLEEAKTYYYEVRSTDEAGNLGINDNGGSLFTFSTINVLPELTVNSSNGLDTFEADTVIYGTATDPSGIASVTVNGAPAAYRPSDGYYELTMALDVGGNTFTVVATDTLGNAKQSTITVTRELHSDVYMTAVSGPAGATDGETITVSNTVANNGPGEAADFYVGFYLSTDNVITISDNYLGYRYVPNLSPGASSPADSPVNLPAGIAPGTYYIGAIADDCPWDDYECYELIESDETNNSLAGNQITITINRDLTMTEVSGPTTGLTGGSITVSETVTLSGGGSIATGFRVGIYLSTDNVIATSDTFLGYRPLPVGFSPGESSSADTTVTIPASTAAGTYYIGAIADYTNLVGEADETNNGLAGNQITITNADLYMSAISGPTTGYTGRFINVSDTVTADPDGGGAGVFSVHHYLSTDSVITKFDCQLLIHRGFGIYRPGRTVH